MMDQFPDLANLFISLKIESFNEFIKQQEYNSLKNIGNAARFDESEYQWYGIDGKGKDKKIRDATIEEVEFQQQLRAAAEFIKTFYIQKLELEIEKLKATDLLLIIRSFSTNTSQ